MIKLIGIPFDSNSSFLKGPALAPSRIRLMDKEGSANSFAELGLNVADKEVYQDVGDIEFEDSKPQNGFAKIENAICEQLRGGNKTLSLGGDHSISHPVINAYAKHFEDLNILHLDAHADLYENFDNNPFSHASPFARIMESGRVRTLTQIGIRTLTTHQKEQATKYNVNVHEMKDFDFEFLKTIQAPLYVSLDLDVLDPAYSPGVSHHEPGGMSTRDLIKIIQNIPVEIVGADIVEYNPLRDIQNMTAMVAYKLMKELIAKMVD